EIFLFYTDKVSLTFSDNQEKLMTSENINSLSSKLPPEWSILPLSKLCILDRKIIEPNSELAANLPYLSLEHIESKTGRILRDSNNWIKGEGKSTTYAFDNRHILYGKLRPYLNKVALPNFAGRCTTELIPFLPLPNVDRNYLAWLLRRGETVEFAMKETTGSRMPRANIKKLLTLKVAIPNSLAEQKKLAKAIEWQMVHIEKAKKACLEQLELIDELSERISDDFPLNI
ncbi:MAG: restriction endonuclease subunit S, partial [Trichodesmium sp.]